MRTFRIHTFGCQMNEHDSEKIAYLLMEKGLVPAEDGIPDLFIVNSCAVRDKAVQKLYTLLGRTKKWAAKGTVVGVVGCVAQVEREKLLRHFPHLSFVIGPGSYPSLDELLDRILEGEKVVAARWEGKWWETGGALRQRPAVAYINIMEGCDKFCTYCIVPFTRGRERYRPLPWIIDEVRRAVDQGYMEIQLLGQNVDSWRWEKYRFWHLLDRVRKIPGLKWVRFITSHPKDFVPEMVSIMAEGEPITPYVHLPLQAGSNRILNLMRRGYSKEEFLEKVEMIREKVKLSSIGTDIIVGFPYEEEEDFRQTLEVVKRVEFDNMYSFHYSPRPLSYAGRNFPDNVPKEVKRRRLMELQKLQAEIQLENNRRFVGKVIEVLATGRSAKDPEAYMGRDITYRVVNFSCKRNPIGEVLQIEIKEAGPHSLKGEVKNED